jgi:site-specific DNA recombinase
VVDTLGLLLAVMVTAEATAERPQSQAAQRLSEDDIKRIVDASADITEVLQNAVPGDKARVYSEIGLQLTYHPAQQIVRAEVNLDPNDAGVMVRVRGGT